MILVFPDLPGCSNIKNYIFPFTLQVKKNLSTIPPSHKLLSVPVFGFTLQAILITNARLLSKNLKIKVYRTVILPVVLYECETWLLTLRQERKLRVFQNMVLRRIFGPRRDEVTGEWGDCITRS